MITKTKEVKVTREIYVACDGTEFTDADDCEAHEIGLMERQFEMYDCDFDKVEAVGECCYVRLRTSDDVEQFIACCDYYGITIEGLCLPGIYAYDEVRSRHGGWTCLDKVMSTFGLNLVAEEEI